MDKLADTRIRLEISKSDNVPQNVSDVVPWRMGMIVRNELPLASKRRAGNRPKKKGYYYRFTGGNTKWAGSPTSPDNVGDGNFEFSIGTENKIIDIEMISSDWVFEEIDLSPPLEKISLADRKITIMDDISSAGSGKFGMIVKKSKGNVRIYVDPDWDNR